MKPAPVTNSATTIPLSTPTNPSQVEKKSIINQELWQACAGPLVNLPAAGTHVVYFPQGHSEQVAASMKMNVNSQIPTYPNLPSKLLCLLHNVTMHADPDTDEVYARMTLQPVASFDKEAVLRSDLSLRVHKPQTDFFCKTLTASDTSTHGGFSVPRRAAEKIFPPLDYSMQPPAQELVARDLHDNVWTFRQIYRGQPKRHLLTTGWSLFVSGKRLFAGDSVLFIRDEKQHLLLGIRRANRQPTNISSSVLSTDSMHIGILAAAAQAVANNSPFVVFYNPRASSSEFLIPLAKYYKANFGQQISIGMRYRMMFETEESGTRRYMGTISGISDLDPRWKNSQWRNLQVDWDESIGGEKHTRVSAWEIEPVIAPFFMCPPPYLGAKRPRLPGMTDDDADFGSLFKRAMPWLGDDPNSSAGLSLIQMMNMQQNNLMQSNFMTTFPASSNLQSLPAADLSRQLGSLSPQIPQQTNSSFCTQGPVQTVQRVDQVQNLAGVLSPLTSLMQSQQQSSDVSQHARQTMTNPTITVSQVQAQLLQVQAQVQAQTQEAQAQAQNLNSLQSHQAQVNLSHVLPQQQILGQNQQQYLLQSQDQRAAPITDSQLQMQLLQRIQQQQQLQQQQKQQQQQSLLSQPSAPLQVNYYNLVQDPPRLQDIPQSLSRPLPPLRMLDTAQTQMTPLPETQIMSHPISKSNSQTNLMPDMTVQLAGNSALSDDIPSCSTSPSTNNCPNVAQTITNNRVHRANSIGEGIHQFPTSIASSNCLETMSSHNFVNELHQKYDSKPLINVAKGQTYQSTPLSQIDYLDSSSATSVSITQNDITSQDNLLSNLPPIFLADGTGHHDVETCLVTDAVLMKNIPGSTKSCSNNVSSGCMPANYENGKGAQQELSSSMVTQSFGVPDMAFNSIDSGITDASFMNQGAWGGPPQYQRLRTYTKVYKRGAVGRSIDVTRYSNYDELKQDLARMFGLVGQMEDRGRAGWKLVYVDHENDVLLVGDDPWEDFVKCVRCIKILSPIEVQQMSLDGGFGDASLPNQACSSSDGGRV